MIKKGNGQPYIVWCTTEEDDDVTEQLFVVVEEGLMLETNSLLSALFGCMAAHYKLTFSNHWPATATTQYHHQRQWSLAVRVLRQIALRLL